MRRRSRRLFGFDPALAAFACTGVLSSLMLGMAAAHYGVFPYTVLKSSLADARELQGNWKAYLALEPTLGLRPARHEGEGVVTSDPDAMQPGLTFMTGIFDGGTGFRLLHPDGEIAHSWDVSYRAIWPDPTHLRGSIEPTNDMFADTHGAVVQADGSVIFNFEFLGLAKVDRCGDLVWRLPYMTHHSVHQTDDGWFWVGGRRHQATATERLPHLAPPFWEDTAILVTPEGEIAQEISLPEVFYRNRMEGVFIVTGDERTRLDGSDPLHLNDVEPLPAALAGAFPDIDAGDLLLSMRNLNLVMVIDPSTLEIEWHQTGPWLRQHDPDFLADGRISVFDNRGVDDHDHRVLGGSRIVAIDPATRALTRLDPGTESARFFTATRGKHAVLANGNLLITETEAGRVFEITPSGKVVWSYVNRHDAGRVGFVQEAQRLPPDHFEPGALECVADTT